MSFAAWGARAPRVARGMLCCSPRLLAIAIEKSVTRIGGGGVSASQGELAKLLPAGGFAVVLIFGGDGKALAFLSVTESFGSWRSSY
jgi:hypothetical protein